MKHAFVGPWRRGASPADEIRVLLGRGSVNPPLGEVRYWEWDVFGRAELITHWLFTGCAFSSPGRAKRKASYAKPGVPKYGMDFGGISCTPPKTTQLLRRAAFKEDSP